MRVGVVGINHKLADLTLREKLAKACQRRFASDSSTHGDQAYILLSTCNRTEIYFFSENLADSHSYLLSILRQDVETDFDQKLYSYFGFDCFLHLSRVTAGLDSAIVAESEIQGQVKTAYESALAYRTLPHEMHYLFQKALKIGKRVRSELPLKPGLPDLEDAVLQIGLQVGPKAGEAKILCVGVSEINLKIISFLKSKRFDRITLCNRTADHAHEAAQEYQVSVLDWERLAEWHEFDWIIFGTRCPEYLLKRQQLNHLSFGRKLIIDLSVPRNVDPSLGRDPRIVLMNIDQINRTLKVRRQKITETLIKAEQIVLNSTKQHVFLFRQREYNQQLPLVVG